MWVDIWTPFFNNNIFEIVSQISKALNIDAAYNIEMVITEKQL